MASLNTSYVDNIVSDEDKTDALQALMQVFKSMAYVTFRISVGAVTARKSIHIEDLALKKKWKQTSCTDNSESYTVFGKYFNILHSSAESLRAAKDTQHPTGAKQRDGSSLGLSFARKRER